MKITELQVDGFGVWSDLALSGLGHDISVFYGPNEAGKSTLLQFVRSILYGFAPRRRYLPPIHGGRPGGAIEIATSQGKFQVARYDETPGAGNGALAITGPDGALHADHFLKSLLGHVDESTFNNVFAVGLREIQELNTLSDIEAARLLYDLTAGLDRISLPDVMRELQTSRVRLLSPDEQSSLISDLLAQREKLQTDIDELQALTPRYARLRAQSDGLGRDIAEREAEIGRLRQQTRTVEIAAAVRDRWRQRAALVEQIAAIGAPRVMPAGAIKRLDRLNQRLSDERQKCTELKAQSQQVRAEIVATRVNESLWRQSPRIEMLAEQQPELAALDKQIQTIESEVGQLETNLATGRQQLGLPADAAVDVTSVATPRTLAPLKPLAAAVRSARTTRRDAQQRQSQCRQDVDSTRKTLAAALAAQSEQDLLPALDRCGQHVTQLRRRIQLQERLDQMARHQAELESEAQQSFDGPEIPEWTLPALGGVFAGGVLFILLGIFFPGWISSLGWVLALIGIGGTIAIAATRWYCERSAVQRIDTCHKQLAMLARQLEQAQTERDTLDQQLPRGGGPLSARLQAAEQRLAALEELLPASAALQTAEQETQAAEQRAQQSHNEYQAARRRWREGLLAAGLPKSLTPKQVAKLGRSQRELADLQQRLQSKQQELDSRRQQQAGFELRLAKIVEDSGLQSLSGTATEQLHALRQAVAEQEQSIARRGSLVRSKRELRRQWIVRSASLARWKHRRRTLLFTADAKTEDEFRRHALEHARSQLLLQQRTELDREIAAAISGHCTVEDIATQLAAESHRPIEEHRTQLAARLNTLEREFAALLERRGGLAQEMRMLVEDRRLPHKLLELASVEQRIREALSRWQVLAVTGRLLELIRDEYERERQPETLQEASRYLHRLTDGHYRRVWTPLGERVLRIDDAEGRSLPVEVLSRGTREQLFLSLRLALAASYGRRGVELPLVLDDVLVNFDAARAKAACAVLRDFAAAGHQLFLFTCHEHIVSMFQEARVAAVRLPKNSEPAHIVVGRAAIGESRPTRKPRRRREPVENVADDRAAIPMSPPAAEEYAEPDVDNEAA